MGQRKRVETSEYSIVTPLNLKSDFWVSIQNEPPKFVLSKWIVVLVGPDPKTGGWALVAGDQQSHESLWKWEFRKNVHELGTWHFRGRKPEFQEDRWLFVSEKPELFYVTDGKVIGKRFGTDNDGGLILADNSQASINRLAEVNEGQSTRGLIAFGSKEEAGVDEDGFQKLRIMSHSRSAEFRNRIETNLNNRADSNETSLFNPLTDRGEWHQLLQEGALTSSSAEIWTSDKKHKLDARMLNVNSDREFFLTKSSLQGDVRKFIAAVEQLDDANCLFSVNLHHVQLFFVTELRGIKGDDFKFDLPAFVFEVQRRFALRYSFPPDTEVQVEFANPREIGGRLTKKIANVSSGGLAFLAEPSEKQLFSPGEEIKGLTFQLGSRKIKTNAKIRHAAPYVRADGELSLKVGVQFQGLRPSDHHFLGYFVHEQIFNYLTRLRNGK